MSLRAIAAELNGRATRALVAARAGLTRGRLLRWIAAWIGVSAVWMIEEGNDPALPLRVGALALADLDIQ